MVAAMRSSAVMVGLVMSVGCHAGASAAGAAAEAEAPAGRAVPGVVAPVEAAAGGSVFGEAAVDLNLPALAEDPTYTVERADGTNVRGYPLPDGRVMLYDRYRDAVALLDPRTGARVELGEAMLTAVPRLGWLIVPKGAAEGRYHDIDPKTGALRLLWAAPAADSEGWTFAQLAGSDRGAPVMISRRVRRAEGQPDAPETEVRLVRLRGPGDVQVVTAALRPGLWIAGADALRGDRLLLVESAPLFGRSYGRSQGEPIQAPVFVLELGRGEVRAVGEATGAWNMTMSVPRAYVAVRWGDHDGRGHDAWWGAQCVNTVDPASLAITPCVPSNEMSGRTGRSRGARAAE